MRLIDGQLVLSASDLMAFMGCTHATKLDLDYLRGEGPEPTDPSEEAALLAAEGDAHELRHLQKLEDAGGVFSIEGDYSDLSGTASKTADALRAGHRFVYQGALFKAPWGGYSDFLERVETPSSLGSFSYEVTDTKLKRSPDPKHVLQLVLYSDLLAEVQGLAPERAHLELGTGDRVSLRLTDYAAYARQARERLEAFVEHPPETRPEPVPACTLCRWREHCSQVWDESDSLALVAGITKSQRKKLETAGITTIEALAARTERVSKLAEPTRARLQVQARLQSARRAGSPPSFELREIEPGRGLTRLPPPDRSDLFYDIEGDPYFEGGLEYLHGIWFQEADKGTFRDFWAHDHEEEREALKNVIAFFASHLAKHPKAHVYHYAPYEITALRRLTAQHSTGEALLDQMLREERFVDLYAVVSGGLIASEPSYSLKAMEAFYMPPREGEVVTAGGSVVAYEKWRDNRDPDILREIRDYNEIDCVSTARLRDWLIETVRPADMPWKKFEAFSTEAVEEEDEAVSELRTRLEKSSLDQRLQALLLDLNAFHKREAKPAWWAIFDSLARESEELIDSLDCLAMLEATGAATGVARSFQRTYRFPEQETKLRIESRPCLKPAEKPVALTLVDLDRRVNEATVKFGPSAGAPPERLDLIPAMPIPTRVLSDAIREITDELVTGNDPGAVARFLERSMPCFRSGNRDRLIDPESNIVTETVQAILDLDGSVLPIQGPPGTGKTYVSSHAVLALAQAGRRVAIASNSHAAIDNLLYATVDRATEAGTRLTISKKGGGPEENGREAYIHWASDNDDARVVSHDQVVGGTAWLFARGSMADRFDTLIVDEAGQVSAANNVAMGRCARNIVLVGDPMQLPQPLQGAHPGESGLSALEYLLTGLRTVPPDRGIFLPKSRRMHPEVCRFISEQVYEGRLTSDPGTSLQAIEGVTPGAFRVDVFHEGNSQTALEEIEAIKASLDSLLGAEFTDRDGKSRPLDLSDILIVAPYNAQVNALKAALPSSARVGTVDRFQGQEAPVCLLSMTTSSADEMPRDLDFLFNLNRLNVAISRAQVLSLVFASPRLLDVPCSTIEQMKLVNTICALSISI